MPRARAHAMARLLRSSTCPCATIAAQLGIFPSGCTMSLMKSMVINAVLLVSMSALPFDT